MLTNYLIFNGNCAEAIEFYEEVFEAKNSGVMKFSDMPASENIEIHNPDLIMHAEIPIEGGKLLLSDNPDFNTVIGDNITINFSSKDEEKVRRVWNNFLDRNSEVAMNLEESFIAPLFGHLTDPFGINWMIMVPGDWE